MSGEYWGRPTDQPDDNQNPDAANTNPPFTPSASPQAQGATESWSAPTYGSVPSAQADQAEPGADTPSDAQPTDAPAAPEFNGPSYTSPHYSTPSYGAPAHGSSTYGSPADAPQGPTPASGYQPSQVPPPLGTQQPSTQTTPSWSATNLNLDAPGANGTPSGASRASQSYGDAPDYGQTSGTGYGFPSTNQPPNPEPPQPYAQPSSAQGYAGGYTQPGQPYSTQDYSSSGYATTNPTTGPFASTPQDAYASTGGYGYGVPSQTVLSGPVAPNGQPYASWGKRVLSYLIDVVAPGIVLEVIIGMAGATNSDTVIGATSMIASIAALAWFAYNTVYLGGTTGQTWGRKIAGTRLLSEATGRPLGIGMAFVRQLAHIVDTAICYIGYLFPLWDAKRQTLADKIVSSVVIDEGTN